MTDFIEFAAGMAKTSRLPNTMERFRDFVAIQDVPPQKTLFLNVSGKIYVPNPGVDVELNYAEPQGINPTILLLNATLSQRPGIWPQVFVWKNAHYVSGIIQHNQYAQAQIQLNDETHTVDVIDRS